MPSLKAHVTFSTVHFRTQASVITNLKFEIQSLISAWKWRCCRTVLYSHHLFSVLRCVCSLWNRLVLVQFVRLIQSLASQHQPCFQSQPQLQLWLKLHIYKIHIQLYFISDLDHGIQQMWLFSLRSVYSLYFSLCCLGEQPKGNLISDVTGKHSKYSSWSNKGYFLHYKKSKTRFSLTMSSWTVK